MTSTDYRSSAARTIRLETDAIAAMGATIDDSFDRACELLLACSGRVVVTGWMQLLAGMKCNHKVILHAFLDRKA